MKREPHWVKLFLRELERTGNVRVASERAGVDHTSAYQRRKRHGEFAERWALRLAAFRSGSEQAGALRLRPRIESGGSAQDERDGTALTLPPPAAAPSLSPDGRGDLVARPDGKLIKANEARWSKRAEERFLTELTVSGSVRLAARAAGFSTTALYKRRLRDRHFAATWEAAVETGKARVHSYLVEAATRTFDPEELPIGDEREMPKVSISEAINIAKLRPGPSTSLGTNGDDDFDATPISRDEWEQAKLNIVGRLGRLRENMQEQERETGLCHACGQALPSLTQGEISA